ncbi:MAG TPA: addiction module protein [Mycobacteriales bacterium]|nr:addiction module protein [Mycobacteriales bacterium]
MVARLEVFDAALTLPPEERAALAHRLLTSLDELADDPAVVASEWAVEVARRISRIETGATEGMSVDEVREQLDR